MSLFMRVLRIYPQMLSLYVGFDNGDFFMVTHIFGENSLKLRDALHAPPDAAFANEIISAEPAGDRKTRWVFLSEDGTVVRRLDPAPAGFDPRPRPWYDSAKRSDAVEQSTRYTFATSGEPGGHPEPQLRRANAGCHGWRFGDDRPCTLFGRSAHHPHQHSLHFHKGGRGNRIAGCRAVRLILLRQ